MAEIVGYTPIRYGKITYHKGAPKNAPRWVWACACPDCMARPIEDVVNGPFKTRRAAMADAEQRLALMCSEPEGSA